MINPESINLATLPSVALCDRAMLPSVPAIYFCLDVDNQVLYIGKATVLNQRWKYHHRHSQLQSIGGVKIAWLECSAISR